MTPSEVFTQRQTVFLQQAEVFQRRYSQLSTARLFIFLATIALVWGLYRMDSAVALLTGIVGLIGFAIDGNDRRFVHNNLIILHDQGIGSAKVNGEFLSKKTEQLH